MKLSEEMKFDGASIHDQQGFLNILSYIPKVEALEKENEELKIGNAYLISIIIDLKNKMLEIFDKVKI